VIAGMARTIEPRKLALGATQEMLSLAPGGEHERCTRGCEHQRAQRVTAGVLEQTPRRDRD